MARIAGIRERRHQPFWDTLVRTTGNPATAIATSTRLFAQGNNLGNLALTNLQTAGQLASDQTYVVLAMRAYLYFNGPNARTNYQNVSSQLFFSLHVGDKPMFQAPCWYYPAGGGIYGLDATTSVLNNGTPESSAIMKLARPIIVPVRQNFYVNAEFFAMGSTVAVDLLNSGNTEDEKCIAFFLDGLQTRDVQ